jgi:PAS domain-containing protein
VVVFDSEGRLGDWNARAEAMFGWTLPGTTAKRRWEARWKAAQLFTFISRNQRSPE